MSISQNLLAALASAKNSGSPAKPSSVPVAKRPRQAVSGTKSFMILDNDGPIFSAHYVGPEFRQLVPQMKMNLPEFDNEDVRSSYRVNRRQVNCTLNSFGMPVASCLSSFQMAGIPRDHLAENLVKTLAHCDLKKVVVIITSSGFLVADHSEIWRYRENRSQC